MIGIGGALIVGNLALVLSQHNQPRHVQVMANLVNGLAKVTSDGLSLVEPPIVTGVILDVCQLTAPSCLPNDLIAPVNSRELYLNLSSEFPTN